jgi:hypothetical protein
MDAFVRELEAALQHYNDQAAGPSKYKVAAQFLLGVVRDNLAALMKKIVKEAAAATAKLAEARKEAKEVCEGLSCCRGSGEAKDLCEGLSCCHGSGTCKCSG